MRVIIGETEHIVVSVIADTVRKATRNRRQLQFFIVQTAEALVFNAREHDAHLIIVTLNNVHYRGQQGRQIPTEEKMLELVRLLHEVSGAALIALAGGCRGPLFEAAVLDCGVDHYFELPVPLPTLAAVIQTGVSISDSA